MVGQARARRRYRRTDFHIVLGLVLLSLISVNLPADAQRTVRGAVRQSVLRPFIEIQVMVTRARSQARNYLTVRAQLDTMLTLIASQRTLAEETRQLRGLLELEERSPSRLVPVTVTRSGTAGSASVFRIDKGSASGISRFDAVRTDLGLLGQVQEVNPHSALAIDWSHPEFRVAAMTADGQSHGLVEVVRGQYREQDRLVLSGTAYLSDLAPGVEVLTSGRGGPFPRGIRIGWIAGVAGASAGWDISYYVDPAVYPGTATYANVDIGLPDDTTRAAGEATDSLAAASGSR
ncbi:MAG: rod shape-determining protein MreC [Gemmatimonadetes bacterium]|nr:rod shape-determining protein MreC [Gemmatimonadota bacterium]